MYTGDKKLETMQVLHTMHQALFIAYIIVIQRNDYATIKGQFVYLTLVT